MNFHPNGHVSICCVCEMSWPNNGFYRTENGQLKNIKDHTLKDIFENSSINELREKMLQDEKPLQCIGCYKIEEGGGTSRRNVENKRWENVTKTELKFIDLRISNKCNLKCMMCYPDSSSSLAPDYHEWTKSCDFMKKNDKFEDPKYYQWFNEDVVEQFMEYKDSIEYLYINGGEPFIMPIHWKFLQRLIDEGVSKNIIISYNTNCTTYDESYNDYWKHFKEVRLGLSVDAIEDKNKFIRYPSPWNRVINVAEKLINSPFIKHINITCTIQWLNAPYLDEFYDWAVPMISKRRGYSINQNFLVFPEFLSLNCASYEFKQKLLDLYNNSKHKDRILTKTMLSYLNSRPESDTIWNQGLKFLDTVEKTRNMGSWKEIFTHDYKF
jgi:MoaA/NifB/PqqE/SkfB family radical SAM enzyme